MLSSVKSVFNKSGKQEVETSDDSEDATETEESQSPAMLTQMKGIFGMNKTEEEKNEEREREILFKSVPEKVIGLIDEDRKVAHEGKSRAKHAVDVYKVYRGGKEILMMIDGFKVKTSLTFTLMFQGYACHGERMLFEEDDIRVMVYGFFNFRIPKH
jgi:hypothetical protein